MDTDRNGFEMLDRAACWALLATRRLGRVGLTIAGLPAILPVFYGTDGTSVVFRSTEGSKLHTIGRGDVICFEVDDADPVTGSGWSVMLQGRAREITDPLQLATVGEIDIDAWSPARANRYVRLGADLMTGRRIGGALDSRVGSRQGELLA